MYNGSQNGATAGLVQAARRGRPNRPDDGAELDGNDFLRFPSLCSSPPSGQDAAFLRNAPRNQEHGNKLNQHPALHPFSDS